MSVSITTAQGAVQVRLYTGTPGPKGDTGATGPAGAPGSGGTVTLKDIHQNLASNTEIFGEWTIVDDGSNTANWPERMRVFYKPVTGETVATFSLNEYGEPRIIPGKNNTVGWRAFEKQYSTSPARSTSVAVIQLMNDRDARIESWGVYSGGRTIQLGDITTAGKVVATNVKEKVVTVPVGTTGWETQPDNTLWIEYEV